MKGGGGYYRPMTNAEYVRSHLDHLDRWIDILCSTTVHEPQHSDADFEEIRSTLVNLQTHIDNWERRKRK